MARKVAAPKTIAAQTHDEAKRAGINTAEVRPMVDPADLDPIRVAFERRNRDLDPQLVWRGKDEQDWSDLVVNAPPLFIQEHIDPKFLINDLQRRTQAADPQGLLIPDLFYDFHGAGPANDNPDTYRHQNWSNRMILGDSLQVMASLAEREGLRGKVQCIYLDPPYGIKFNSNFQWSTTSRDVKDGHIGHITREPEQVKAFRDTWADGIHSYLTYLRDRLTVARDLLTESGSIFVQIGDENVHRVRAVMDEVFGDDNFVSLIAFVKTQALGAAFLPGAYDYLLWFGKNRSQIKFRPLLTDKQTGVDLKTFAWLSADDKLSARRVTSEEHAQASEMKFRFRAGDISRQGASEIGSYQFEFEGKKYLPSGGRRWASNPGGMTRLVRANRVQPLGKVLSYRMYLNDFPVMPLDNGWHDTYIGTFTQKTYVVQTGELAIQRCLLMTTDPGDLVLDPTCGSGTTATVAEQWGRRWITIDTSRVALALARARVMGARYPYYLLADSREGQAKEADVTRSAPSSQPTHGNIRHGFVYERVPHITLKSIANNAEIDVIWDNYQAQLEPLRAQLNAAVGKNFAEWEIPREADKGWPDAAWAVHAAWWQARIARQKEIDASIAAKADSEYLYDKPYQDPKKVRVAGPFTVETVSPHRTLGVDENDELIDPLARRGTRADAAGFAAMVLANLRTAGVQQANKADKIEFTTLEPWPGTFVAADGRYREGETEKRAAIFIGPEFGTVQRADLVAAAREAADAGFDVLVACAFAYEAHATEMDRIGRVLILKARMNADLHMAGDLKNTGKGNLFVIFGEPDLKLYTEPDGQLRVKINGVDVFHPNTGEVRSDGAEGIACWFLDTDYNEESFFVRHAYFLGASDPYGNLKTTLKAEIDADAWATLNSDISRPFPRPASGRIAVKVINHLGDEVMKVLRVT